MRIFFPSSFYSTCPLPSRLEDLFYMSGFFPVVIISMHVTVSKLKFEVTHHRDPPSELQKGLQICNSDHVSQYGQLLPVLEFCLLPQKLDILLIFFIELMFI